MKSSYLHPNRRQFCTGLTLAAAFGDASAVAAPKMDGMETVYPSIFGEVRHIFARHEDTLLDIARNNGLGFVELVAANPGVDPWIPGAGRAITLPTAHLLPTGPREGILLNLIDQRIYFFPPDGGPIQTFAIGTGQEAWNTPIGNTKILRKKRNPSWYVPKSIRKEQPELPAVVRPGPDNPLGRHAMYLGWRAYLIHGTNNAWGVGRRVSHGCIRMYPEGIGKLFPQVAPGTPVTVVKQEAKTGWHGGKLYLEIHPNPEQNTQLEETGRFTPAPVPELAYLVAQAAGKDVKRIDWKRVKTTAFERSGIPVSILKPAISDRNTAAPKT
jgi:L,D-transpeptidase ErfK/SrfK